MAGTQAAAAAQPRGSPAAWERCARTGAGAAPGPCRDPCLAATRALPQLGSAARCASPCSGCKGSSLLPCTWQQAVGPQGP